MNVQPVLTTTASAVATRQLGAATAIVVEAGDLVVLVGGLGAGKTCFVQGFAAALGVDVNATSPTFALVHVYEGPQPVVHADLYRLASEHEILDLGLDEAMADGAVAIVEWGDVAGELLAEERLTVTISHGPAGHDDERALCFVPTGASWCARRAALVQATEAWR